MFQILKNLIKKTPLFPILRPIADWMIPSPPPDPERWEVVKDFGKRFNLPCLVETGTYLGATIQAVKGDFKRIYSIELDHKMATEAKDKFKDFSHITIIEGDSSKELIKLLPTLQEPVLFWLDAHYSGGITAKGDKYTPIMAELDTIFTYTKTDFAILIDDARDFRGKNDYPTVRSLKKYVHNLNSDYTFEIAGGIMRIFRKK